MSACWREQGTGAGTDSVRCRRAARRNRAGAGGVRWRSRQLPANRAYRLSSREDNLAALRILAEEIAEQHEAVASSQYYLDLAMTRFRAGIDSYLNVITAQTTLLSNRVTEVDIQLRQMTSSVGLIMSLGGGWDVSELPPVRDVSRGRERGAAASTVPGKE